MGLLSWLGFGQAADQIAAAAPRTLATPFVATSTLSPAVVLDDLFGGSLKPVTRAEAMAVPTWARARNAVCTTLARQPVVAYGSDGQPLADQPGFLTRSKYFPPRLRMLWTIDDCAHYGWSLWVLDRGAADQSGRRPVLDAMRVDPRSWRVDQGKILVGSRGQEREVPDGDYLLIPGPSEGLLTIAADTIRGAKNLERRWQERVDNPIPITEIRYTGDADLQPTADERKDIRQSYLDAAATPGGVVMVTPAGFEVHAHGDQAPELFIQGRNAVGLDVARYWQMRASLIDASQVNGSSVDYENNGIGRSEFYDLTLRAWALPIEEALSQDDVLPRGTYVQFDLSALTTPDAGTGPALED